MNRNFILLFSFIFLLNIPLAIAQPGMSISPDDLTVQIGEEFEVKITTDAFIQMTSIQFTISWDPSIIELDTFSINLTPEQLFWNETATDQGIFSLLWNSSEIPNSNFDDGTNIFTINFKAIANGKSLVEFANQPTVSLTVSGPDNIEQPLRIIQNGMTVSYTHLTLPTKA